MARPNAPPPALLAVLCSQLKRLQRVSGLTQAALASHAHLSPQRMSEILNGDIRRLPDWDLVTRVVQACVRHADQEHTTVPEDLRDQEQWRRRYADLEQYFDNPPRLQRRAPPKSATRGVTGLGGRMLPAAGSVNLEARVHQTVLPIPYIRRDVEDAIHDHLHHGRPVLLIGSSMVGKTKMAARVIAEEFGSWPAAIPESKTALADLDSQDVAPQGAVIWLDDIDRLIGAGGITDGALRRLAAAGNIIVATIRARAYERFQPSDWLRLPEWDVLSVFERVFIGRDLTRKEEQRLATAIDDPDIRDRIRTIGIGEYVGAAVHVAEALKLGATGTDPVGYALVLAAADWQRCGPPRPIPASLLAPLARPYLDQRSQVRLASQDAFALGLAWATREINPNVSLLQPAGTDSYLVYDYALDLISAQDRPIPDSSWAEIMTNTDPLELVGIGYDAAVVFHQNEVAIQALRKAAGSGHADAAPIAELVLGMLLKEQGDVQGARHAWQNAAGSGHADLGPTAAFQLGLLLAVQGDTEGAKAACQEAIDSGHADQAPPAAFFLGVLLKEQGDAQGARAAYQMAVDSGHPDAAPSAADSLGLLLAEQGDIDGAKAAYQMAIDSGHAAAAPMAANNLGVLLKEQGDVPGARAAYQMAVDSGHPDAAPPAAISLGGLLAEQGDVQGAKAAYQKAIDSGHADQAPKATFNLAFLLYEQGDMQGASAAYQKAIDSGHIDVAPKAAVGLGVLLEEHGDVQGAKAAYQKAIDSGHIDAASLAEVMLGNLCRGSSGHRRRKGSR